MSAGSLAGRLWPSADQLLLLQAALEPDQRAVAAFGEWASRLDADEEFARESFRLLPMAFHNMHRLGVAHPVMGRLKGVYRKAWYENHQLFHRLRPLVARLVESGIDVLLLKGAPLVLSYYRNHALRPMVDFDIVVRPDQAADAGRVLEAMGWWGAYPLSDDVLRYRHAVQFFHAHDGEIDLHFHALGEAMTRKTSERFWATAEPLRFEGVPVKQLDPTSMLLHIVIHGVRSNLESPVRWIADAIFVLRSRGAEIDWDRLVALARSLHITHRLALGLSYLASTFTVDIPRAVLERLRARPASLVERIENTVALAEPGRFEGSALGNQWVIFVDYCRTADASRARTFLPGLSHYVRYRWGLERRREIVRRLYRGARKRLSGNGDGLTTAASTR